MSRARPTDACPRRPGFTLVETVLAMGIAAILLVGMAGALSMSMTALDRGKDRNADAVSAAGAADTIAADLNEATSISSSGGNLTLTVQDRDGDGNPDTVTYSWDGVAGSQLFRDAYGSGPQILLPKVDLVRTDLLTRDSGASTSGEVTLVSFDSAVGATFRAENLSTSNSVGQYVRPPLADNADAWRITHIWLWMQRLAAAAGNSLRVSIVKSVNWAPTGDVLASVVVSSSDLGSTGGWFDIWIDSGPVSPAAGVFIKVDDLRAGSGSTAAVWSGTAGSGLPYNTYFASGRPDGTGWSAPQDSRDLRIYVYGTVTSH